ncbi:MAG: tetratricopeptide repeat protein, partial [Nocardiopsaceae bacterium]|nr:tetratricopeptide repeat protein [Nocardiopsaceae bacterium]
WLEALPGDAEARRDDPIMLRLTTQLANVYRSLDRLSDARELDEDTLVRERRVLGLEHPRTLMTARSYGADLRLVGDFEEALLTDSATWQLADQTMGRDHLLTITASGNLALSELLAGEPEHALQRRRDHDLPWCERFEKQRPEESAWVLGHIGILQRELGRYPEALASLRDAKQAFERSAPGGTTAPSSQMALLVESGIAIVERRLGRPQPDTNWRILEECRAAFGETSPLMWAIILSLAGDLAAAGQPGEAVRKAQQALQGHSSFFGPNHPFTWISQVDLGNYALAAGQLGLADEMSRSAHASLESSLGPRHLWTLAAAVARANVLAVTGHPDDAAALEEPVLGEYRKRLGAGNPLTRAVMENDRHTRRLRNEPGSVADPAGEAARRRSIELDIPPY